MTDPRSAGQLPPLPARPASAGGPDPASGSDTERFPVPAPAPGPAPLVPPGPVAEAGASVPAWAAARRAGVPGLRGSRGDLRTALVTVLVLAVSGLVAGGIWTWLAPRADYRVTETDVVPVSGLPNSELFMSDDGVYVLVLGALGLLAGLVVWRLRSRRGALLLAAVALGMLVAGVVAWQLGARLGEGPTEAQLHEVGRTVTTGLDLRATAALAVGPFAAVLAYLVAATLTSREDLGRPDDLPVRPPLPPVPPPAA